MSTLPQPFSVQYPPMYAELLKNLLPKDYSKMSEQELFEELKKSSDFDKLVFPSSWYEKYNLPTKECMDMKQFIKESPWMKRHSFSYVGRIEDIPAKPGGNRPVLPIEPPPALTILENHFSDGPHAERDLSDMKFTIQNDSSNQKETQ